MFIDGEKLETMYHESSCGVSEFNLGLESLGLAKASIKGRYPESGSARNLVCEQVYVVIEGTGTVFTSSGSQELKKGDSFLFEKGERYHVEGKDMKVLIVNSPNRSRDQYETHKG